MKPLRSPDFDAGQILETGGIRGDHDPTAGNGRRGDDEVVSPSRPARSACRCQQASVLARHADVVGFNRHRREQILHEVARAAASIVNLMPTPIALLRAVSELNDALADAGHADLARGDNEWTKAAREDMGHGGFDRFLDVSLRPVMNRLGDTEHAGPDVGVKVQHFAELLAALWDAVPFDGERGPSARQALIVGATAEQAAVNPGFLRAVADMAEAAWLAGELQLLRSPQEWAEVVMRHLPSHDLGGFATEAIYEPLLTGSAEAPTDTMPAPGLDELNDWLALAIEIWNNTPQPDRGFRTAYEIALDREAAQERAASRAKRKRTKKVRRR